MELNLDIFKPKTPPLFGLDISSSSVKIVEVESLGKGGKRLEYYTIELLPKDAVVDGNITNLDAVVEAVRRAWSKKAARSRTKNVAMALPTAAVITKKITVPAGLSEEELELQVETEANQYIPFALEEVNLDFQVIGPAPSGAEEVEGLIAASRKEKVEDRVAVAEAAGLKAIVMDVESYAVQTSFKMISKQFPNEGRDQNIALVDIGANVMNITVLRNDQAVYTREQAFGGGQLTQDIMRQYGMSQEEAENAKRSGGLPENYEPEVLKPFMENAAMEIQRALQFFFTSTQYNTVDHILLTGGSAVLPGLDEVVSRQTQINTLVANPFADMAISPRVQMKKLAADAPSLMIACGLAMRRFDP
ncbi:MAG: pilus assembly protein PilM [Betaproteobacteria bacterium]|nr:pilus assembly protein PilM [Betaproteobacteria bacterium]